MPSTLVEDSIESLARVIPWSQVSTRLSQTIRESDRTSLLEEACSRRNSNVGGPSSSSGRRSPNDAFSKEMRMTVNAVMSLMAACRNATIPVSVIQRYKDVSENFKTSLARAVTRNGSANANVVSNLRSFRAEIQNLTSECQLYAKSRTMYQKASMWVLYIISFVNIHNLVWVLWSTFHATVFDHSLMMQGYASMIHEVAKENFNAKWAKWILNVVTYGVYSVSPRGIVTRSEVAYDYMKMYDEHIKGRFIDVVSKVVYHMIAYMIKISGRCSKAALEVFAKILEPRSIALKPLHKMFIVLFVVASSMAAVQTVVVRRRTIATTVRRTLPTTVKDLSARIYQMITSIPMLKRKRALNPAVNVHRAITMANRTMVVRARRRRRTSPGDSPAMYYNANSGSNTDINEYVNALNHNTVENVAALFQNLSLNNR
jgi:hypothetical protein